MHLNFVLANGKVIPTSFSAMSNPSEPSLSVRAVLIRPSRPFWVEDGAFAKERLRP